MKVKKLNNVSLIWFTILLYKNGPISVKKIHIVLLYYFKIILSIPPLLTKTLLFKKKIENVKIRKEPVFILGHFRSGTSYLHKLLLADRNFGYLTNFDFLFPNLGFFAGKKSKQILQYLINFLKIKNFHFNDYKYQLNDPNEEDLLLASKLNRFTSSWGFIFPENWEYWLSPNSLERSFNTNWSYYYQNVLRELTFKTKDKQLVLKNPPNTGRVEILLDFFPKAKFIYISRNPYHLYYSLKHLWKNVICKYYSLQLVDDELLDKIIFEHYTAVTDKYNNDKYLIPEGNLIEISFDDLEASPYEVIKGIYLKLNLDGFSEMENELRTIIEREKKYKKFNHKYSADKFPIIEKYWGKFIQKGNYNRPELKV